MEYCVDFVTMIGEDSSAFRPRGIRIMSPEDTASIVSLFAQLKELPPERRGELLARIRESQPAQAEELERLLAASLHPGPHWSALLRPLDAAVPEPELPAGTRIGRFVVDGVLGKGGMGVVYAGHRDDGTIEQRVAIKLSRLNETEGATLDGLVREASLLSTLRHPGIAQFHDIVPLVDGRMAMVVEHVDGERLDVWLKGSAPSLRQALNLLRAIAESVRYAHGRLVLHGDIKPANVMLDAQLQPRLLDFGIAVLMTDADGGHAFGASPGYAAPEVLDAGRIDMRSDVYSLGKLGQALLARVSHEGGAGRYSSHADLVAVLERATATDPSQRHVDVTSLLADLDAIAERRPVPLPLRRPGYTALRLLQRRPGAVGLSAAAIAALLVAVVGIGIALAQARTAERTASERAGELEKVAKFQADQLSSIDVAAMGVHLRETIVKARADAAKADGEAARREAELALQGVNFTDIARDALDQDIFARALQTIDRELENQPLLQARLLMAVGDSYVELGLPARAQDAFVRALELYRTHKGAESAEALEAECVVAENLMVLDRPEESGKLIRSQYEVSARLFPEDHPVRLYGSRTLGTQLSTEFKLAEALALFEQILPNHVRTYGEGAQETLKVMKGILALQARLGQWEAADRTSARMLDVARAAYGPDSAVTLDKMNYRVNALVQLGRIDEAIALGKEELEGKRRLLGEYHNRTLAAYNNLGAAYKRVERFDEAEPLLVAAAQGYALTFGKDNLRAMNARAHLQAIYIAQRRFEESDALSKELLDTARRSLGNENSFTIGRMQNRAVELTRQGKLEEAAALSEEALAIGRRVDGERHPNTLRKMDNLATVRRRMGKLDEAEALGAQVLEAARATLPPEHPDLVIYLSAHARSLIALKRHEEAQERLLAAYPILLTAFGADNPQSKRLAAEIADLYDTRHAIKPDAGFDSEAARWRKQAEGSVTKPEGT